MKIILRKHGIEQRNAYTNTQKYGNSQTYSGDYSYAPDIYSRVGTTVAEESKDYYSSPTTATHEQKGTLEVTQTFYNINVLADYMDNRIFHQLIFGTGTTYWLASRCAACYDASANFGLRVVNGNTLLGYTLFYAYNNSRVDYYSVRPVVSLGANVKISTAGGTEDSPRDLSI